MGFSVSVSTAIIFAGLFLAAGILYPAMDNGMERVLDAEDDRDRAQLDLRNTVIEIQSVDNNEVTVTNNGSTSLAVDKVDVIIDGEYRERNGAVDGPEGEDSNLWLPGESITVSYNNGDERVKVVTEHGISVSTEV